jgi:hypothetical protein
LDHGVQCRVEVPVAVAVEPITGGDLAAVRRGSVPPRRASRTRPRSGRGRGGTRRTTPLPRRSARPRTPAAGQGASRGRWPGSPSAAYVPPSASRARDGPGSTAPPRCWPIRRPTLSERAAWRRC